MALFTIEQLRSLIVPIAKRHGVKQVWLFGSYAKGTATDHSDVDLLIEKGRVQTLLLYNSLVNELEDTLQCHVDLLTTEVSDKAFVELISQHSILLFKHL